MTNYTWSTNFVQFCRIGSTTVAWRRGVIFWYFTRFISNNSAPLFPLILPHLLPFPLSLLLPLHLQKATRSVLARTRLTGGLEDCTHIGLSLVILRPRSKEAPFSAPVVSHALDHALSQAPDFLLLLLHLLLMPWIWLWPLPSGDLRTANRKKVGARSTVLGGGNNIC